MPCGRVSGWRKDPSRECRSLQEPEGPGHGSSLSLPGKLSLHVLSDPCILAEKRALVLCEDTAFAVICSSSQGGEYRIPGRTKAGQMDTVI